jgi:hypothetical protein
MENKPKIPAKENKEQSSKTEEKIQCYKYCYGKFKPNGYIIEDKDGK